MSEPAFDAWNEHLSTCKTCRRAIRGRFGGMSMDEMRRRCCLAGQDLYADFVRFAEQVKARAKEVAR